MTQIVVIQSNDTLRDLLVINLKTYIGADVIVKNSAEETIALLKLLPQISLIVCEANTHEEYSGAILSRHFRETKSNSALIILGEISEDVEDVAVVIKDPTNWEGVVRQSAKMLGITTERLENQVRPDYLPIPISYFLHLTESCCDVFIRIKKSAENYQYIKRIHAHDQFAPDLINRYIGQGVDELFIPKGNLEQFTIFLSNRLVMNLEEAIQSDNTDTRIRAISNGYDIALSQIAEFGFNHSSIQLTEALFEAINVTIRDQTKLPEKASSLLTKILNSPSGFLYQHAHLTAIIAAQLLEATLQSSNESLKNRLIYAAMFQNLTLANDPALGELCTHEELESEHLIEARWDLVFNHALEASLLVRNHPDIPFGVDTLLCEHHGAVNGKGLPTTVDRRIQDESRILLIAQELATQLLRFKQKGGHPAPLLNTMKERFADPKVVDYIDALSRYLKPKN